MKLSQAIKLVTYLQDHASDLIQQFAEGEQTFVITENGEARAVFLDIRLYEQMQEGRIYWLGGGMSYVIE